VKKEMEIRKTMIARKVVIGLVAALAIVGFSSAAMLVSNELNGTTTVHQKDPLVLEWAAPDAVIYPGGVVNSMYVDPSTISSDVWGGVTYGVAIRLYDPNSNPADAPKWTVKVKFEIHGAWSEDLTTGDISIKYYAAGWYDLPISYSAPVQYAYGNFGPAGGFDVQYPYDVTTNLQVTFSTDVTEQPYLVTVWAETL
jgi:hypothetical protein